MHHERAGSPTTIGHMCKEPAYFFNSIYLLSVIDVARDNLDAGDLVAKLLKTTDRSGFLKPKDTGMNIGLLKKKKLQ